MNLSHLQHLFKNRSSLPEGKYEHFSVLVPLLKTDQGLKLLFEIRSEKLTTQPKEICFPGGRLEPNETFKDCSIRETCEELHLSKESIEVFGPLDDLILPYNMILHSFIGSIRCKNIKEFSFNKEEVSSIFTVPLDFFIHTKPKQYQVDILGSMPYDFPFHLIPSGKSYKWRKGSYPVLFYIYEDKVIWGMTARIIKNFIDILKSDSFKSSKF